MCNCNQYGPFTYVGNANAIFGNQRPETIRIGELSYKLSKAEKELTALRAVVEAAESLHKRLIEAESISILIYNQTEFSSDGKTLHDRLETALTRWRELKAGDGK